MTTFADAEFLAILEAEGVTVVIQRRTHGDADALGDATWTDGAKDTVTAIVHELGANDLRKYAGILQEGDLQTYFPSSVTIEPNDRVLWDGKRYMTVTQTPERAASTIVYRDVLLRRAA